MKKYALYGAGNIGIEAYRTLHFQGCDISCFIDGDEKKCGTNLCGVPVKTFSEWLANNDGSKILLTCSKKYHREIKDILEREGVAWEIYNRSMVNEKERLISFSNSSNLEDIILYHILKKYIENLFYIDVGCNDSYIDSVTKLFYDRGACGINIDPVREYIDDYNAERPRDINLCLGCGRNHGSTNIYLEGGLSTMRSEYVDEVNKKFIREVEVSTLTDVCKKYISSEQEIHFLKIDVEGMEHDVIAGMDFEMYRPWVLCIEATKPLTNVMCFDDWEPILLENQYIYIGMQGVNRYYISKEKEKLSERFLTKDEVLKLYHVYHADIKHI